MTVQIPGNANVLSYHVYNRARDRWLADDEHSWQDSFDGAASFLDLGIANAIMEREGGDCVFVCIGSA